MKFFISILTTALIACICGAYFPWWTIAVAGFVIALLLPQSPFSAFFSGFIAIFLLWTIIAALINTANGGILSGRIGLLLGIGKSPVLLVIITGLVGGIVAGFAALSASLLRRPVKR